MSSVLDDFFSKKDKKKKKGFTTFNEEVDKKQKEIEHKKKFYTEETVSGDEMMINKEKNMFAASKNPDDDWNDILEKSLLADVLPDAQDEAEENESETEEYENKDTKSIDSISISMDHVELSLPVTFILDEVALEDTDKAQVEAITESAEQDDNSPKVVMIEEQKKKNRFGVVINRNSESVKLDDMEDFPDISFAAALDTKKGKKSQAILAETGDTARTTSTSSSGGRFFSSSRSSTGTVATSILASTSSTIKTLPTDAGKSAAAPRFFSAKSQIANTSTSKSDQVVPVGSTVEQKSDKIPLEGNTKSRFLKPSSTITCSVNTTSSSSSTTVSSTDTSIRASNYTVEKEKEPEKIEQKPRFFSSAAKRNTTPSKPSIATDTELKFNHLSGSNTGATGNHVNCSNSNKTSVDSFNAACGSSRGNFLFASTSISSRSDVTTSVNKVPVAAEATGFDTTTNTTTRRFFKKA